MTVNDYNARAQAIDVNRVANLAAAKTDYAEACAAIEREHSEALRGLADEFIAAPPSEES